MAETKFTPGSWTVSYRGIGFDVVGPDGNPINSEFRETFREPDARLIAAAPDLLDALLRFVHWYDTDATEEELDDAYYEAQHAICEALGERASSPSESRESA